MEPLYNSANMAYNNVHMAYNNANMASALYVKPIGEHVSFTQLNSWPIITLIWHIIQLIVLLIRFIITVFWTEPPSCDHDHPAELVPGWARVYPFTRLS